MEILQIDFMQRAIWAGLIVAVACPLIGVFLVVRRQALIGDGLGHIAFAGVTAGWLLGWQPVWSATLFTVLGALGIEKLRQHRSEFADTILAIFFYSGMALAVVLASFSKSGNVSLSSFLFGSIVTVSQQDVWAVTALSIVIVVVVTAFYKELSYISFDEEAAMVSGLPVRKLNLLLSVLTAITVAVSMRVVGLLLVSALMVIPVACSLQVARSFLSTTLWAVVYSLVSVLGGLLLSFYANLAPGGTIVLSAVALFICTIATQAVLRSVRPVKMSAGDCGCAYHGAATLPEEEKKM